MTRRMIAPLIFGLLGCAVLIGLGIWQMQRLEWKTGILAAIESRLAEPPVSVPADPDPTLDQYRRIETLGVIGEGELHVYSAAPSGGVGYRIIAPLILPDDRRILLDRGFAPIGDKDTPRLNGPVAIRGSLLWPDDGAGGPPDLEHNIWITRDSTAMAATLNTLPVLVVASETDPTDALTPLPVMVNIPNNHLGYVVTWFGLAAVWAGMTLYLLWRIKRRSD